jgi:hypothetical protein
MLAESIMCAWLISSHPVNIDKEIAKNTCELIATRAKAEELDPSIVISLAYHESHLNPNAISKSNARGPLQVMPSQCKRWKKFGRPLERKDSIHWRNCDLIAAGLWTWKRWRSKSPNDRTAVCRYNAGYKCRKGTLPWRWAGSVVRLARKLRKEVTGD